MQGDYFNDQSTDAPGGEAAPPAGQPVTSVPAPAEPTAVPIPSILATAYEPPPAPPMPPAGRPVAFTGQPPSMALGAFPGMGPTALPLALAAGGAVAGGVYAGGWGALAGLCLTGALTNAYRSMTNSDGERGSHMTFAAIGAALGGWAAYKAYKGKESGGFNV